MDCDAISFHLSNVTIVTIDCDTNIANGVTIKWSEFICELTRRIYNYYLK